MDTFTFQIWPWLQPPLRLQGAPVSHKFQADFLPALVIDVNSIFSKPLSDPGYISKRTYTSSMLVYGEKFVFILWNWRSVVHHFSGNYYILQLFHLPKRQNLSILVLILTLCFTSFQLPLQLPPSKLTHLYAPEMQCKKQAKQQLQFLILHTKSSPSPLIKMHF